jgi:hypothetical protein
MNELIIIHNPSNNFGKDCITIDVNNTSDGALHLLAKDLEDVLERRKQDFENWHPITEVYADLLKKLSEGIKSKLNQK